MRDVVLLNSGGKDTAMLAAKMQRDGFVIHSLYVDTHQLNTESAQIAAAETASRFCVDHYVMSVPINPTGGHSAQFVRDDDAEMYDVAVDRTGFLGVCPNHSLVNISLGVAYATVLNCMEVYGGWKQVLDQSFLDHYNELTQYMGFVITRPRLILPLYQFANKQEVADFCGVELTDFDYTYSCKMGNVPCGTCAKCRDALPDAGM